MPSAVSGRQCPAESPTKKMPSSAGVAQPVRDPVALVADRIALEVLGQQHRGVLDVEARVEGADADAQLLAGREAPAVAGGHVARGRSRSPSRRRRPRGAPRARATAGRPAAGSREPSTRRQPRASTTIGAVRSPRSVWTVLPVRPPTLAVSKPASDWAQSSEHSSRVVEGREGPGQLASARCRAACGPPAGRTSGGASPSGRAPAATRWGSRRPTSGARRSRSGRAPITRAPVPASSRATASPAKLAPQIRTSTSPDSGVRSEPRLVRRVGMRAGYRAQAAEPPAAPPASPLQAAEPPRYPCRRSARHRHAYPTPRRRGLGRTPARGRRPDRPQLRRHHRPLRGGRRGVRQGRPDRPGRGPGRHRLQERGRHPAPTSCRSASRSTRTTRSSWARRSTRWSSPRRTRTAGCCCRRSAPASRRPGARSRPPPSPASRSRAP